MRTAVAVLLGCGISQVVCEYTDRPNPTSTSSSGHQRGREHGGSYTGDRIDERRIVGPRTIPGTGSMVIAFTAPEATPVTGSTTATSKAPETTPAAGAAMVTSMGERKTCPGPDDLFAAYHACTELTHRPCVDTDPKSDDPR